MPARLRAVRGLPFVCRAPTDSGEEVPIRVSPMRPAHVLWWHSHVQPIIDEDSERADHDWNWPLYASFAAVAGRMLSREPSGFTIGLADEEGDRFIPCALVQLLGRVPALDKHHKHSAFVWFLSTAPDEALMSIEEHPVAEAHIPKRLGAIALDVAVTHSLNERRRGRVALHADEDGGEPLLRWYQRRGMRVLPASKRLPEGPRRLFKPSDGRYCYYTVADALRASRELDPWR